MHIENTDLSSLETSRSHAVALIVSDITNPFFAEIIPAIEERLGIEGFVVFVGNTSEDRKKEERLLAKIREFPPDGILICPALGGRRILRRSPCSGGSAAHCSLCSSSPRARLLDTAPRQLGETAAELLLRRIKKDLIH